MQKGHARNIKFSIWKHRTN